MPWFRPAFTEYVGMEIEIALKKDCDMSLKD